MPTWSSHSRNRCVAAIQAYPEERFHLPGWKVDGTAEGSVASLHPALIPVDSRPARSRKEKTGNRRRPLRMPRRPDHLFSVSCFLLSISSPLTGHINLAVATRAGLSQTMAWEERHTSAPRWQRAVQSRSGAHHPIGVQSAERRWASLRDRGQRGSRSTDGRSPGIRRPG